ncbi:MAG TPA: hypothetical protein VMG82_02805 [Candidatus Sulfotelmatobacter sp.]|nr:hypothetical protein [Candidatus Sulfotelmatobacter sp.]
MERSIRRFWPALLLAVCCFSPYALGQTVGVNIYGAGQDPTDGIYMSPYYATLTSGSSSSNFTIICDDFADNSYLNTPFTASLMSFSSISSNLGSTLWGSSQGFVAYEEAAWLTEGLLNIMSQPTVNKTAEAYYSFAMWAVMDPSDVLNWLKSYGDWAACQAVFGNNCTSYTQLGTNSLLYQAEHQYGSGNYSNLALLTPMSGSKLCTTPGTCVAQEFFVQVAEGGAAALYLLLAAFVCFGAMFIRARRPRVVSQMA